MYGGHEQALWHLVHITSIANCSASITFVEVPGNASQVLIIKFTFLSIKDGMLRSATVQVIVFFALNTCKKVIWTEGVGDFM